MATLYTNQAANTRKTWLLMTVFLVFIILLGWFAGFYFDNPFILFAAVFFSVAMNITSYWFSDKIVLKMSGARAVTRDEYFDLYNITENLAITAGLPMPALYIIEDPALNAFATGRNKDHAAIAVTSGLLKVLDKTELEGVIAHEMAHIGNKDILLQTIIVVLVGFVALLSDFFIRFAFHGSGDRDNRAGAVIIIIGIALAILSPVIATIIQLAISRKREFLADSTGALLTRYPEGLASALEKISHNHQPMQKASNATAHLFIATPFAKKSLKGMHKLFLTHPPVEERISALRGTEKELYN